MTTGASSSSGDQARLKRVEMIVRQLETLPTLPVVATRLLQATTARETSAKQVISLIQSDPSLTAKILSLTRKACLGVNRAITTVDKAVLMLGFEAVRNAVLSIQVFETFGPREKQSGPVEPKGFDRQEFWKHSLAVACAAQLIIEHLPDRHGLDADEVFVCGLLHDLGKVALDACLPKSFARVVEIAVQNHTNIADAERRILGLDHAAIGKRLAEHWKLPEPIVHAIWLHHHKSASLPAHLPHRRLADVVHLADLIAREQRIGFSGNFVFADRSEPLAQRLGIGAENYQKILLDLRQRMGTRSSLIGLDELSSEQLYQQALQAANAELGRLNQSLTIGQRKLQARTRYFDAINDFHRKLTPNLPLVETLEHVSGAMRTGLDVPAMVVYRQDRANGLLEAACSDENGSQAKLFEMTAQTPVGSWEAEPNHGYLIDPPEFLHELIVHYGRVLSPHPVRLIPLTCRGTPIGGALVSADEILVDRLERERSEVEAVGTACALALGQSSALESKDHLAEELLTLNRRMQDLERKLLEVRCLAAVGELAAGAAHELNNPLAIISGRAQLLQDQETDPDRRKALQAIVDQADRASQIVTELMEFAKPVRPQPTAMAVGDLLAAAIDPFVQTHQLKSGQICVERRDGEETVFCDRQQLTWVLTEILTNALEASGPEALKVNVTAVREDDGQYVQIRVRDEGPGMDPAAAVRALDPFFSARKAGRGRGLGLSRAYRYVQSNHGTLWLESAPGMGTTAFVRLPVREPDEDMKGKTDAE